MGSCQVPCKMVKAKHTAPAHCAKKKPSAAPKKAPKYYPAEDVKGKLGNFHNTSKPTKLRKSIQAGSVVIMLAGHFKGCRVVILKQLPSGLLLVTGPYKVNGVPLRRIPQSYVIATSTRLDLSKLSEAADVSEQMFVREKKKRNTEGMFEQDQQAYSPSSERKSAQEKVDEPILAEISKTENLRKYMRSLFTLRKGQYPHEMKF